MRSSDVKDNKLGNLQLLHLFITETDRRVTDTDRPIGNRALEEESITVYGN